MSFKYDNLNCCKRILNVGSVNKKKIRKLDAHFLQTYKIFQFDVTNLQKFKLEKIKN